VAGPKEGTKLTHTLRDFKGVNTQASRQNIGDDQFAWLENVFPLGYGNMLSIAGPSGILGSWPTGTATFFQSYNLNDTPILIVFTNTGGGYSINLETNAVTQFAADGTFSDAGTVATSWSDTQILIIDPANGYFTYDGTTLTQVTGTIQTVVVTLPGSGYTSVPTLTIAAPGSGTTATATASLQVVLATASAAGTSYQANDILTLVGGTFVTAAQFEISAVNPSTGAITGFNIINTGQYSVIPTGSVAVTGGFGTGATFTLSFGVGPVTITNPGTGYTANAAVTLSGGSGSGASLTADVSVAPSNGVQIATYASRVWIANANRTIIFSAPGSFTDFSSANAGGSFVMTDSTLINVITALYSANNYLYIFGKTSINVVSGVQVVSGNTVFSNTNITASIGTNQFTSITPYYRGLAFATNYGFYILNGTTCEKISNDLDGYFTTLPAGVIPISGGYFVTHENICLGFLAYTNDLTYSANPRALLAIYFNKKWTFSSQGDNLTFCCTALYNGIPVLYGTDGTNFYSLLTNDNIFGVYTFRYEHLIVSKLWDMGATTREKEVIKFGLETTVAAYYPYPTIGIVDTEQSTNFNYWNFYPGNVSGTLNYAFNKTDIEVSGKYIGVRLSDQYPNIHYNAFHIQYEMRADWTTLPTFAGLPPFFPPAPTPTPTPAPTPTPTPAPNPGILTAVAGNEQTTETWVGAAGATSYNLYWSLVSGTGTAGTKISGITATTYVHTGLTDGTTYYYVVTAVNAAGESGPSNQASATPFAASVYVSLNSSGDTLAQLTKASNGQLSALSPEYITGGNNIQALTISPDGISLYGSSVGSQTLNVFSRSIASGLCTYVTTLGGFSNSPGGSGVSPDGKNLYVAAGGTIHQYARDLSGNLTALQVVAEVVITGNGSGYTSVPIISFTGGGGSGATAIAVVSGGRVTGINVTSGGSGYTSAPSVIFSGGGGSGASANAHTFLSSTDASSVVCHPNGIDVYVASTGSLVNLPGNITHFTRGISGELLIAGSAACGASNGYQSIIVSPKGVLYCTNSYDNTISIYAIGGANPIQLGTSPVGVGTNPYFTCTSKDGNYLYVSNTGDSTISQFSIGAGGALTSLASPTVSTGTSTSPRAIAASADGKYLYVVINGGAPLYGVGQFSIGTGGLLTPLSPYELTLTAGTVPYQIICT
jgi:6-phosphogluconolactonase (cycloisomerase 2 family)